jgi:hypothetical protein
MTWFQMELTFLPFIPVGEKRTGTVGYGGILALKWQLFPVLSSGSPIGAWREPVASELRRTGFWAQTPLLLRAFG